MSVFSAETIFSTLEEQTDQVTPVKDIVQPIPESTEEQEKLLQVQSNWLIRTNLKTIS